MIGALHLILVDGRNCRGECRHDNGASCSERQSEAQRDLEEAPKELSTSFTAFSTSREFA